MHNDKPWIYQVITPFYAKALNGVNLHGQKDLNPRPTVLETVALPAELCPCIEKLSTPPGVRCLTFIDIMII